MPPIEKASSVASVTPIAPAQRGQVRTVARVDVVSLRADAHRKCPLQLDVPLSSFVPPLDAAALKAEGFLLILMPPNEAGARPLRLVDGPKGPAVRLELDEVEPDALVKIPVTFDIGNVASLSQVLHMGAVGDVPVSAGRFKCQVQLQTVAMDRTAPALLMVTSDLLNANQALDAQQRLITELQNQTTAGTSFRQLENQLADARAVLASTVAETAAYRDAIKTLLRQQPPSVELTAASGDGALAAAWGAFREQGTPANAAAWSSAREAWLSTASDANQAFAAQVVAPGQLPKAPKLSISSANVDVLNLTAELERRRAMAANSTTDVPEAIERLAAMRANRDKIAARARALETGTNRDLLTSPTQYDPSSLLTPSI